MNRYLKIAFILLLVYAGWMYYAGQNQLFDLNAPIDPLPTYSGYHWQGQLSAYPSGEGAIPYVKGGSANGVLEWDGGSNPLYGGH